MCSSASGGSGDTACGASHELDELTLLVTNVQRYSLHDGGGIRTVVFCKGCPFTCPWCCNPENLSFEPEVSWKGRLCMGCSVRPDGRRDANGCPCDTDPARCPTGAKELMGTERTLRSLVDEIIRDLPFYEESGGGMTVSGGEALAGAGRQHAVAALFAACRERGVATALESTLAVPLDDPDALAAVCDTFLVDFKIADRELSRKVMRLDTAVRDRNLRALLARGARVVARLPIIPGYTDAPENVRANATRARELGIERADILPFHQLGEGKYDSLGLPYRMRGVPQLTDDDVRDAVRACELAGLDVVVRGE